VTEVDLQHDNTSPPRPTGVAWQRRICLGIAGLVGVATLAACGSSSSAKPTTPSAAATAGASSTMPSSSGSSAAAASQPAAAPAVITIDKFAYSTPASVAPGAAVMVLNKDGEAHTVTADSGGAFDDKATPGASTTFTAPMKPGSYPFHCTYHSNMHGVLVVK
jgi:plastocyanin